MTPYTVLPHPAQIRTGFRQSGGTVCHRIWFRAPIPYSHTVLPYRTPSRTPIPYSQPYSHDILSFGYLLYHLYLVCVVLIRSTNFVARTGFEPVWRINSTALKAAPIDQTTVPCYVLLETCGYYLYRTIPHLKMCRNWNRTSIQGLKVLLVSCCMFPKGLLDSVD